MALEVDPAELAKDAEQFGTLAGKALELHTYLAKGSNGLVFPAGDKVSDLFKAQWEPLVQGVLDIFQGFHDGMHAVEVNIHNTAALYYKSNEVNTESIPTPPARGGEPPAIRR